MYFIFSGLKAEVVTYLPGGISHSTKEADFGWSITFREAAFLPGFTPWAFSMARWMAARGIMLTAGPLPW